jgi:NAD(P)-dependent dehydrogenase (short-subunit alcohol dehydrogenase family)
MSSGDAGIALVTGANRGIGLEVVRQLAQQGFTAVLGARDLDKGRAAAERLAGEGLRVEPRRLDESRHGRIVNVSSGAGSLTEMGGGSPAYRVSKTALNALTRILAAELRPNGILVNSVCPGWVATDMGGPGGRPVEQGAASVMWAVLLPDDGPTGGFFRDGRRVDW